MAGKHGGPRPGSGRPKGSTKLNVMRQKLADLSDELVIREDEDAVDFMDRCMRHPGVPLDMRLQLAQQIAPYQRSKAATKLDVTETTQQQHLDAVRQLSAVPRSGTNDDQPMKSVA